MTLNSRIEKLEEQVGKEGRLKIIVGSSDSLQEQCRIFKEEHPEFHGTILLVTDVFKPSSAGMSQEAHDEIR